MGDHSTFYREYLASPEWQAIRERMLERAAGYCERCYQWFDDWSVLEIHHLTYARLGKEKDSDLLVVCPECHILADAARAAHVRCRMNRDGRHADDGTGQCAFCGCDLPERFWDMLFGVPVYRLMAVLNAERQRYR